METKNGTPCDYLLECLVGDAAAGQRKAFESHLPECPACAEQWKELTEAWSLIPETIDLVEPPARMKEELMTSLFGTESADSGRGNAEPAAVPPRATVPRARKTYTFGATAAAVMLAVCLWFYLSRSDEAFFASAAAQPLYVEQSYALRSYDKSLADARGTGWIVCQGKKKKLVLNVSGLAKTAQGEAYQVWLIRNGQRQNAGTFLVDPQGSGVLIYDLPRNKAEFEEIGITLEPDADGREPRGQKVLGS
ncbi:anti-sigma factor [Paenibacillus sp. GYB003]|uniref:anti-sigma factor n=1 Tax=Paenibacillus sp. GYB003 TaxID=2994392 RepID=UPI002F9651A5